MLIPRYLSGEASADAFLAAIEPDAGAYSGFNLLLTDSDSLWYGCNRAELTDQNAPSASPRGTAAPGASLPMAFARSLSPGVYGLSNQFLDTPWPKLRRVRRRFESWLGQADASTEALFAMLEDRTMVEIDEELPRTGLSREWERVLSAPFVLHPDYGTRCSTVALLEHSGACVLIERRFDRQGVASGESAWRLSAGEWP